MRMTPLLVLALATGCAPAPPPDAGALMETDRAFALAAEDRRLEGWMSYMAEDAVRFKPDGSVVRGRDEIRALDGRLWGDESLSLEWSPHDAGLFGDGIHGFTTGRYELIKTGEDGSATVASKGTYVTVWRREASGWKVILDTGSEDPPAEDGARE